MCLRKRLAGASLLVCQKVYTSGKRTHSAAPLNCEITVSIVRHFEFNVHEHVHLYFSQLMMVMQSEMPVRHNDIPPLVPDRTCH